MGRDKYRPEQNWSLLSSFSTSTELPTKSLLSCCVYPIQCKCDSTSEKRLKQKNLQLKLGEPFCALGQKLAKSRLTVKFSPLWSCSPSRQRCNIEWMQVLLKIAHYTDTLRCQLLAKYSASVDHAVLVHTNTHNWQRCAVHEKTKWPLFGERLPFWRSDRHMHAHHHRVIQRTISPTCGEVHAL